MRVHTPEQPDEFVRSLSRRHLLVGWAGLLIFLSLGIVLETLHGLKLNFYLDPRNVTRRLMWTLAHAHGTLFSLIHIAFAVSMSALHTKVPRALQLVSRCLIGALILMPLGFFAGGLHLLGGDPGVGVFLVPIGALMILVAVATFFGALYRDWRGPAQSAEGRTPSDESVSPSDGAKLPADNARPKERQRK